MEDPQEWRDYDPSDLSTHPEEATDIQIEYANGRRYPATYTRQHGGGHTINGPIPSPETMALKWRWRYNPRL
jgi:hypothetical protein